MQNRWIGALVGFFLLGGSLAGALIGYVLVSFYENARYSGFGIPGWSGVQRTRDIFFNTTFQVLGHLAKADGRVSEHEIVLARQVMQQMRLGSQMKARAIRAFGEGKASGFDLGAALSTLKAHCGGYQALLHLFMDTQRRFVQANGALPAQMKILQTIQAQLGLGGYTGFGGAWYRTGAHASWQHGPQSHSSHQQGWQSARPSMTSQLNDAYQLLGIKRPASEAAVKRAYRKMMSQHHPDKLMAKGLPEEMIKLATEKTQQIQAAYDLIGQQHDYAT